MKLIFGAFADFPFGGSVRRARAFFHCEENGHELAFFVKHAAIESYEFASLLGRNGAVKRVFNDHVVAVVPFLRNFKNIGLVKGQIVQMRVFFAPARDGFT